MYVLSFDLNRECGYCMFFVSDIHKASINIFQREHLCDKKNQIVDQGVLISHVQHILGHVTDIP